MAPIQRILTGILILSYALPTTLALGATAKDRPGTGPRRPALQDTIKTVYEYTRSGQFDAADSLSLALLARIDSMRTSDSTLVAEVLEARVNLLLHAQQFTDSTAIPMAIRVVALRERIQGAEHLDVAESLASGL